MKTLHSLLSRKHVRKHAFVFFSFIQISTADIQAQLVFNGQPVPGTMEYTNSTGAGVVQTGDFNKDGYTDILFSNGTGAGAPLTYWQNNGNGGFSTPLTNPFASYTSSSPAGLLLNTTASIADFDCDGDLDIWGRVHGPANDVYLRNDNGTYTTQPLPAGLEFTPSTGAGVVQVADFSKDGCVDILYTNGTTAGGGLVYLQNDGGGSFSTPVTNPFAAYTSSTPSALILNTSCSIADFDGDGDMDVWGRAHGAGNDAYLRNDNGAYTTQLVPVGMEYTATTGSGVVQTGDFNGDGYIDILFTNGTTAGSGLTYWQNNGSGSFSTPATNPFSSLTASTPAGTILNTTASIADFDGDGDLDIWARVHGAGNDAYISGSGEAPQLVSSTPSHNAASVVRDAVIYLHFNENVKVGNGAIYIHRGNNGQILQIIGANSADVTGSGTSTLAINPLADLNSFTEYYITFSRGAIMDVDDNLLFGYLNETTKQRMPHSTGNFLRFTTSGVLPVSLLNFTAVENHGNALLTWQTVSEQNSKSFIVQSSAEGSPWKNIGTVLAAGNSSELRHYKFESAKLATGKNYFRIVQEDRDNRQQLSEVRLVRIGEMKGFKFYPNPAKEMTVIQLESTDPAKLSLYNAAGQVVWQQRGSFSNIVLPLEKLSKGLYYIELLQNEQCSRQQLIVD